MHKLKFYWSLCIIKDHSVKDYCRRRGGVDMFLHLSLIQILRDGEWLGSSADRFTSGKSFRYLLNSRLGRPQNRTGRSGSLVWYQKVVSYMKVEFQLSGTHTHTHTIPWNNARWFFVIKASPLMLYREIIYFIIIIIIYTSCINNACAKGRVL